MKKCVWKFLKKIRIRSAVKYIRCIAVIMSVMTYSGCLTAFAVNEIAGDVGELLLRHQMTEPCVV